MSRVLNELTIVEAARGLRAKEFTVRELWDACHAAAVAKNPELNAYLEIFDADDAAIEAAQKRVDANDPALLCGIPLAIKDNILIEGKIASAASKMLETYKATYDATVITKLKEAGALFVGRTNMDEFALGGSTENSAFGVTKNPHDLTRVAGGTSGGSAAAVAAHMCIGALGTDTGGSVRNPASYCGVVGLKPTYGTVSRSGVIAAVSSFDQVGPIAKTVEDAKIMLDAIRGQDPLDATSENHTEQGPDTKRIAILSPLIEGKSFAQDTPVFNLFDATIKKLRAEGFDATTSFESEVVDASLAAYYIINFAEFSTNVSRYDGIRYGLAKRGDTLLADYVTSRAEGFGQETKRRIVLGTYVLSSGYIDAYYRKATQVRDALRKAFLEGFNSFDIIASPTMPTPAFKIGEKADPVSLYLEDVFTVMANLTGVPAISVPMGTVMVDGKELPVGIQFMAPHGGEERLLALAQAVENLK